MPTDTYIPIASTTLSSASASVTFSSIPQDYRDLVLVVSGGSSGGGPVSIEIYPNNESTNGSSVQIDATSATVGSSTLSRIFFTLDSSDALSVAQIMEYSTTDRYKNFLFRDNNPVSSNIRAIGARWASNSAITSLVINDFVGGQTFDSGTTFALYGIEA